LKRSTSKIEEGEFVVLLGETGCGKSTLLRMVLGQERPTSGSIAVSGSDVQRVDARSGYVPQKYSLFPDRTVLDNLTMGPETSKYHILGRLLPSFRAFRREVAKRRCASCSTWAFSHPTPASIRISSPAECSSVSPSPRR
jgi:NitT/TauT family transport system ATP-binding protein